MPVPRDRVRLKIRQVGLKLNHHHRCGSHRDRCSRMQHNAEWTMVGVRVHRVDVHHLDQRKQRKKEQADDGYQRQSLALRPRISAQQCPGSSEHTYPTLQEYTGLDASRSKTVTMAAPISNHQPRQPFCLCPV